MHIVSSVPYLRVPSSPAVTTSGTLNAFVVYFTLALDGQPGNTLSSGPDDEPNPEGATSFAASWRVELRLSIETAETPYRPFV